MQEHLLPKTLDGCLDHVVEECAEVISECAKVVKQIIKSNRFGLDNTIPETNITNKEFLQNELNDLKAAIVKLEHKLTPLKIVRAISQSQPQPQLTTNYTCNQCQTPDICLDADRCGQSNQVLLQRLGYDE